MMYQHHTEIEIDDKRPPTTTTTISLLGGKNVNIRKQNGFKFHAEVFGGVHTQVDTLLTPQKRKKLQKTIDLHE